MRLTTNLFASIMSTTAPQKIAECISSRIATGDLLRSWDGADDLNWLADGERAELDRLTHPQRRNSFLQGRWLAKQLIREYLVSSGRIADGTDRSVLSAIAIGTRDAHGDSVRPAIRFIGEMQPWSLSLSHTETAAAAVFSADAHLRLGVDLTIESTPTPGFIETWFDADEQEYLNNAAARETTAFWTAKEAVYKALNTGERFTPRAIHVSRDADGALSADYRGWHVSGCAPESGLGAQDSGQLGEFDVPGHAAVVCVFRQAIANRAADGQTADQLTVGRPIA